MGDVDGESAVDPKHREAAYALDKRLHGSEERLRRVEEEVLARIQAIKFRRDVIGRDQE